MLCILHPKCCVFDTLYLVCFGISDRPQTLCHTGMEGVWKALKRLRSLRYVRPDGLLWTLSARCCAQTRKNSGNFDVPWTRSRFQGVKVGLLRAKAAFRKFETPPLISLFFITASWCLRHCSLLIVPFSHFQRNTKGAKVAAKRQKSNVAKRL